MRVEAFSETYAGKGFLRGIDARVKLVFAAACLLLAVVSSGPAAPITVGAVCAGLLRASGVPFRAISLRMAEPLFFALVLALFQALTGEGEALASLDLFGVTLAVGAHGLHKGAFIVSRVFGGVSAVLFLTMCTPVHDLLAAAAWSRLPRGLVELLMLTYRYVFVLIEDAATVYHAQRGRLGYIGLRRSVSSLGTLCGTVLLRAFAQAEATGTAMALRGYTGEYVPSCRETFRAKDAVFLSSAFSVCLAVFVWTL